MSALDNNINLDNAPQEKVPNNVGILVLGICSIFPGCFCYGLPGIVCGIIALVMSQKANRLINDNPNRYDEQSKQLVRAGKICAIIGLCLSILFFLFIVLYFLFVGALFFSALGAAGSY
ncbi:MAG: CCC motif membrane protein [Brumimicrobium sp.]|nr:CCC motif membrane protein [Brumimicrobium sp.]